MGGFRLQSFMMGLGVYFALGLIVRATPATKPAGDGEKKYPIKIETPAEVGSKRKVKITLTQILENETKKNDNPDTKSKVTNRVELRGVVEVQAVDKRGRETQILLTVEKFELITELRPPDQVLAPGTEVAVTTGWTGRVSYTLKDKQKLGVFAERVLPRTIWTCKGSIGPEDAFGTVDEQKVGASWGAGEKLKEYLETGREKAKELHGDGKLVGVKMREGKECLEIQTECSAVTSGPPMDNLVPVELTIKNTVTYLIPADYSSGPVEERSEVTMVQTLKGKAGTAEEGVWTQGRSTDVRTVVSEYLKK